jgi:hypothetical protein
MVEKVVEVKCAGRVTVSVMVEGIIIGLTSGMTVSTSVEQQEYD